MPVSATETVQKMLHAALDEASARVAVDLHQQPLVLAVSGGADSLALLHSTLHLLPDEHLIVAHLNHQLRPEAAAEAIYVAELAGRWNLRFATESIDVGRLAEARNMSLETAARTARYEFLGRVARANEATFVLTGHHAGDQAETVLMHILRGSGVAGLRGMLPISPLPGDAGLTLLRPLLALSRETLAAYCAEQRLVPVVDESNLDLRFLRNRLRNQLLPLLAQENPQIENRLRDLADIVATDYALLETLVDEAWVRILEASGESWVRFSHDHWLALPLALRRSTLRRAIVFCLPEAPDWSFQALESQRMALENATTGTRISLPDGFELSVAYGNVEIAPAALEASGRITDMPQIVTAEPQPLFTPGEVELAGGWRITARPFTVDALEDVIGNPDPWRAIVRRPADGLFYVRGRQPGERFQPLGLSGHYAKVKEMMIDRKIPAQLRDRWPLVVSLQEPVWLVGHAIAYNWRIAAAPSEAVELRCSKTE